MRKGHDVGLNTSRFRRREAKRVQRMNLNKQRRAERDLVSFYAAREITKFKNDASSESASEKED